MTPSIDAISSILAALGIILAVSYDAVMVAATSEMPPKKANRRGHRSELAKGLPFCIVMILVANSTIFIYRDDAVQAFGKLQSTLVTTNEQVLLLLLFVICLFALYATLFFLIIVAKLVASYASKDKLFGVWMPVFALASGILS